MAEPPADDRDPPTGDAPDAPGGAGAPRPSRPDAAASGAGEAGAPGAPPPDATARRLRAALEHATGEPVAVRETHISTVLLTRDRAYKVKKAVRMGFVDQSTPEQRRALCEQEVRLNQPLAAGVVLGVRAIVPRGEDVALADADVPGAIDWAVEMRRFAEDDTLAARLGRGAVREADLAAVARRIAAFHRAAEPVRVADAPGRVRARSERNLAELRPLLDGVAPAETADAAMRFVEAFVTAHGATLQARADAGLVVDAHGDLRAEHVVLEDGRVAIVDRLEFDRELRVIDVADDLGFLAMDLEALGARWAADALVRAYRAAAGDGGAAHGADDRAGPGTPPRGGATRAAADVAPDRLVAFFGVHRAHVRAKVALLRAAQLDGADAERAVDAGRALLALADRLAWRARGPLLLLVTGPPASGKSTLARALAAASGLPVVSSDAERKRALGLAPAERAPAAAYTAEQRAAVYRRLAERAVEALAAAGGAIVDATFGDARLQEAFFSALAADVPVTVVECAVPPDVLARRARERTPENAHGSDADADVARHLAESFTPVSVPGVNRLTVHADGPPDRLAQRVAFSLDLQGCSAAGEGVSEGVRRSPQ
jgi:hypothetical protein